MRVLRVNMADKSIGWEDLKPEYSLLGGRALTSRILLDEVDPTCHPLGPGNKLVFAPGSLTGTSAPSSGRLSVGGKSPLTGTIKEANAGGICAQKMANLGIAALIVEGMPKDEGFQVLVIGEDKISLEPAGDLTGMGCYALNERLWEKYGEGCGIMCIGPAGENKMLMAGVSTNDSENHPGRYAGRGGLGALMGTRGLKAIVLQTKRSVQVKPAQPEKFKEASLKLVKALQSHAVTSQALPAYGTDVLINILNEAGGLPTRNFSAGRFEDAANLSGEALAETVKQRGGKGKCGHGCHPGCVIRCSNIYPDEKGEVLCAPIEYESVWALGANCGIGNLDQVAMLNRLCNDVGLDTIETGDTLAVLMEAGVLPFGDAAGAIALLDNEVRKATPLGRVIGAGTAIAGKVYGVRRVPVVKGQGLPAYDPRAVKGIGVTYATTTMGADHTAGYAVTANILGVGGTINPLEKAGQVDLSRNLQVATAFVDSFGLCLFTAFALLDIPESLTAVADLVAARYGVDYTVDDAVKLGQDVLKWERAFNIKAGFNEGDDRLPDFFKTDPLAPHNTVFDVTDEELDEVMKPFQ